MKKDLITLVVAGLVAILLAVMIFMSYYDKYEAETEYGLGFDAERRAQMDDNIERGVMDKKGKWLPKHELAR